jgi:hypothetical protein
MQSACSGRAFTGPEPEEYLMANLLLGLIVGVLIGANVGYVVLAFLRVPCPEVPRSSRRSVAQETPEPFTPG